MNKTKPQTIDITPTWTALLHPLLLLITDGETKEARDIARIELMNMARAADRYNAHTAPLISALEEALSTGLKADVKTIERLAAVVRNAKEAR